MTAPLAIDLFCGLGGWADALLAEGYYVIGFDLERHEYGDMRYRGQLVIQDVTTLCGSQFRNAALIVASPPCTEFSYMAMPWTRAKKIADALRGEGEFPADYHGSRAPAGLTALFDACFRIQREACDAAGRHIPLIVENVRGAIPWVGRSRWNFGSFHLWGDVPALMPVSSRARSDGIKHLGSGVAWFDGALDERRREASAIVRGGVKAGKDCFGGYGGGFGWDSSPMRRNSSKSPARKAASAMIAKIPEPLARHIARVFRP